MWTDSGWDSFFENVKEFCAQKGILVVNMDEVLIRSLKMRWLRNHKLSLLSYRDILCCS
jgi:hypothetical protein